MRSLKHICLTGLLVLAPGIAAAAGPTADLRAAAIALRKGDYRGVVASTARALNSGRLSRSDAAWAYNARGLAWKGLRRFQSALADLNVALGLSRCYPAAHINRGLVRMDLKQYRRAAADFTAAINCRRGSVAKAHNNRGVVRLLRDRLRRAIADFDQAIRLRPRYAIAYRNRALAYQRLGHRYQALVKALPFYNKAAADWQRYLALGGRR